LWLDNNHITFEDFDCSMQKVTDIIDYGIYKAGERAGNNDYNELEISVTTVCEDNGPIFDQKYIDITTQITRQSRTALIHFVYDGPATNQVDSTVRVRPRAPLANGNAIVALNEADCSGNSNGVIVGGSSGTFVHGGGIWSNGCLKCNGSAVGVIVDPPDSINYAGNLMNCGPGDLDPNPVPADPLPQTTWDIDEPDCTGLPNRSMPGGKDVTLNPGVYTQIDDNGKDIVRLNPGLYCVTGKTQAVKISSGLIFGSEVTIFATEGSVKITGGGDDLEWSELTAPVYDPDPSPAIPGILIYMAHGNTSDVQLTGNSESVWTGTVYAPDANITLTGTGDLGAPFSLQLIGNNVQVEGDAYIDMNFLDNNLASLPPLLDMLR
jgi:hypothetical protein